MEARGKVRRFTADGALSMDPGIRRDDMGTAVGDQMNSTFDTT